MMTPNSWSIEYNHSLDRYHLGRTSDMVRRNISSVGEGRDVGYICVGIFESKIQAEDAMLEFRRKRSPSKTIALF